MNFYITGLTLKQFRHETKRPVWISDTQLEKELQKALDTSSKIFYGRLRSMRVFRISIPGRKTVYAVGRPMVVEGKYNMQIVSIKSMRAYYSSEAYMRYNPSWGAKRHYKKVNYNACNTYF